MGLGTMELLRQIQDLQHPFKWVRLGVIQICEKPDFFYEEGYLPMINFVLKTMEIYFALEALGDDDNRDKLADYLTDIDKIVQSLRVESSENADQSCYSMRILNYIAKVTKCYLFYHLDNLEEAERLFQQVKDLEFDREVDRGTVNVFTGLIYTYYRSKDYDKAVEYFRLALGRAPYNALYNFLLAKCLRKRRRKGDFKTRPGQEEMSCFLRAYRESRNVTFGIFLAQMYRENEDHRQALRIYREVYENNSDLEFYQYLRLAMGFVQLRQLKLAKDCLDRVARICPQDSVYLHYKGIYNLRKRNIQMALKYLKKSAELKNHPAARQYFVVNTQTNREFNGLKYMLKILRTHDHLAGSTKQGLLIDIAILLMKKPNYQEACKYFLEALKIDPTNKCLRDYKFPVFDSKNQMEYDVFKLAEEAARNSEDSFPELSTIIQKYSDLQGERRTYLDWCNNNNNNVVS